jgi:hypothetical protein
MAMALQESKIGENAARVSAHRSRERVIGDSAPFVCACHFVDFLEDPQVARRNVCEIVKCWSREGRYLRQRRLVIERQHADVYFDLAVIGGGKFDAFGVFGAEDELAQRLGFVDHFLICGDNLEHPS